MVADPGLGLSQEVPPCQPHPKRVILVFEMRLRSLYRSILALLVGYAVLSTVGSFAIGGPRTHPSKELFPFFTWSLFSWVPDTRHLYVVEVMRIDGNALLPPKDLREIAAFDGESTLAYKATQELGRSRGRNESLRQTFEARYLKNRDVEYRLVRKTYNPLERWRSGEARETEVIAEFASGSGQ